MNQRCEDMMGKIIVAIEVTALVLIVALIDDPLLRVALAVGPSLLLTQRALDVEDEASDDVNELRSDAVVRNYVDELLRRIRQFYSACHLLRSDQITSDTANERISEIEADLNRMLADIMSASKGEDTAEPETVSTT